MAMTETAWPPTGPTTVQNVIKSYPYVQFGDDDNIRAFFDAYNAYAQAYLDYFNALNLPIYTQDPISGALLDWVMQSIYGMLRPSLPTNIGTSAIGPVNTFTVNYRPVNGYRPGVPDTYTSTTDDTARRVLTWAFYKGDSKVFTPRWLKRRINRFLNGVNGGDVTNDTTYDISVSPTGFKQWTIQIPSSAQAKIFQIAVETGVLELPLQITWTVVLI